MKGKTKRKSTKKLKNSKILKEGLFQKAEKDIFYIDTIRFKINKRHPDKNKPPLYLSAYPNENNLDEHEYISSLYEIISNDFKSVYRLEYNKIYYKLVYRIKRKEIKIKKQMR